MSIPLSEFAPDLIISVGPNCRNTFNVRRLWGFERAYPFDWWITPISSALHILSNRKFNFHFEVDDFVIIDGFGLHNTIYNKRLHVLHHHDFNRVNHKILPPSKLEITNLNEKYAFLIKRMNEDIGSAERVLLVSNGIQNELNEIDYDQCLTPGLNIGLSLKDISRALGDIFDGKVRFLAIADGEPAQTHEEFASWIRRSDDGTRIYAKDHRFFYAEPVNVYDSVFRECGFVRKNTNFNTDLIKDPEDELQRSGHL